MSGAGTHTLHDGCRASAKLMGLSLHGGQGPCVLHAQGSLLIQGCLLHSRGQGEPDSAPPAKCLAVLLATVCDLASCTYANGPATHIKAALVSIARGVPRTTHVTIRSWPDCAGMSTNKSLDLWSS